jgi:FKBP-type peptidyl-prolyl cis-trans isomerase
MAAAAVLTFALTGFAQEGEKPATPPPAPADAKPADAPPGIVYVKMETSLGDIILKLDGEKAPVSVANFLKYAEDGFYKGTIFHRVIKNFMIQGGGYLPDLTEKSEGLRPGIKNEWQNGLKNARGTIAMARLGNQPDSATAQFFINVVDNAMLDQARDGAAYAVFGKVVGGMDVVDKIRDTEVKVDPKYESGGQPVVPVTPVEIKSVTRFDADKGKALEAEATAAEEKARAEAAAAKEKALTETLAKIEAETGKKVEKTASGLMYVVLQDGSGPTPVATDTVKVHYTGWLLTGSKDNPFDSSVSRGQPAEFPLNRVIKGWTEGVALMKVGEKRRLIIPSELAYGKPGRPPVIPPDSTLVFDIELLGIQGK